MNATDEKKKQLLCQFIASIGLKAEEVCPGHSITYVRELEPYKLESTELPNGFSRGWLGRLVPNPPKQAITSHYRTALKLRFAPKEDTVYVYYCEERWSEDAACTLIADMRRFHPVLKALTFTLVLDTAPADRVITEAC